MKLPLLITLLWVSILSAAAQTTQVAYSAAKPAPEHTALLRQLLRDGLIPPGARSFVVTLTKDKQLLFNGQPQSAARLAVYQPLLLFPASSTGTTTLTMSLG